MLLESRRQSRRNLARTYHIKSYGSGHKHIVVTAFTGGKSPRFELLVGKEFVAGTGIALHIKALAHHLNQIVDKQFFRTHICMETNAPRCRLL